MKQEGSSVGFLSVETGYGLVARKLVLVLRECCPALGGNNENFCLTLFSPILTLFIFFFHAICHSLHSFVHLFLTH